MDFLINGMIYMLDVIIHTHTFPQFTFFSFFSFVFFVFAYSNGFVVCNDLPLGLFLSRMRVCPCVVSKYLCTG